MIALEDIRKIQEKRPDLSDQQAEDVISFLLDMDSIEPIKHTDRLFENTAAFMYGEMK